jgi:glycosyltransferase involved in cell wall biosynthesis
VKQVVLAQTLPGSGYSMVRYGTGLHEALVKASYEGWSIESLRLGSNQAARDLKPSTARESRFDRYVRYPIAVSRVNADVVHIVDHGYAHLLLGLNGTPTIVTCHDTIPWLMARGEVPSRIPRRVMWSVIMRLRMLNRARHIIADSHNTRRDLERLMPLLAGKISVIYPGVGGNFTRPPLAWDKRHARDALGIPGADRLLLGIGGSKVSKNALGLLRIFAAVHERTTGVRLAIVGSLTDDFRRTAREMRIADRLHEFRDLPEERLVDLYRASDVLIFPSWYEGFGWPPLEAMACGVPVVASRAGSLAEVLGDGALLFEPSDTLGFANAIERLLGNSELAQRQIEAGLRRSSRYTWEHTAEQVFDVYKHVLGVPFSH